MTDQLPELDPLEDNPYDLMPGEDYGPEPDSWASLIAFTALTIAAFMSFAWFLA